MQPGADEVDYRETSDITKAHAAIRREHTEPQVGTVPAPLWLIGISFVAVLGAGIYLGMFSGGFRGDVFNEREGLGIVETKTGAGAGGAVAAAESPRDLGKKVFSLNCASCHQASGLGVPGQYPPLAKSDWVLGSPKRLAMILLKGLQGPVDVAGQHFPGAQAMPAWGTNLSDKKISQVLTYIRSEWGNNAPEVTEAQIAAARKEFANRSESWGAQDLLAVPADAQLQGGAPAAAPAAK